MSDHGLHVVKCPHCKELIEDAKLADRVVKEGGWTCTRCRQRSSAIQVLFFEPPFWDKVKRFFAA